MTINHSLPQPASPGLGTGGLVATRSPGRRLGAGDARRSAAPGDDRARLGAVALCVVVLAPVVAVVILHAFRTWTPLQDFAVIDLRVRDVWSRQVPLTGAYSRMGWDHPGPAMYWLIAPLSLAAGRAAWATLVGAALLQGAALVWLVVLAYRRAGLATALAWTTVAGLSYAATGSWLLLQPWNPHVAYPFYLVFLLYAWLIANGQRDLLPGAAVVASFLVQTHVGYVPLVAAIGLPVLIVSRWTAADCPQPRWRWAAIVLAVGWLPVALDCVLHPPGNLATLAHYFLTGGHGPAVGVRDALRLDAAEFRWPPPWLGGHDRPDPITGLAAPAAARWLTVPAIGLLGGYLVARRAGNRTGQAFVGFAALVQVVTVLALSRVLGDAFPYLFYWRIPAAVLTVVAVGWALATSGPPTAQPRARGRWTAAAAAVACAALVGIAHASASLTDAVATANPDPRHMAAIVDQFASRLQEHRPTRPVLVRFAGSPLGGLEGGLFDELARRGTPVRVDRNRAGQFGRSRGASPRDVGQVWYVAEQGYAVSLLTRHPRARVVAEVAPLPPGTEDRIRRLQQRLASQLQRAGDLDFAQLDSPLLGLATRDLAVDHRAAAELAALNERVARGGWCRCAVVALPPGPPPGPGL